MQEQVQSRNQDISNSLELIQQLKLNLDKTQVDRQILIKKKILPNNKLLDDALLFRMKQKYMK